MRRKCRHFWRKQEQWWTGDGLIFACLPCRRTWAAEKAAAREQAAIDSLLRNNNAEEA